MSQIQFPDSELIINPDGSIFHLNLLPDDIADTIITVGDPERLNNVASFFDRIEIRKQKREFATLTGTIGNKRLTCISTGIGTDNIDIVINELDALANIDFKTRTLKPTIKSLNIIRIGTSGSVQSHIPVDSWVLSKGAVGMDGLLHFYKRHLSEKESMIEADLTRYFQENKILHIPLYYAESDDELSSLFESACIPGITLTNTGFYAPQGRVLRYDLKEKDYIDKVSNYRYEAMSITNFEMETAGIYGLGKILGHRCCALNAIIANRKAGQFSEQPQKTINNLITFALDKLTS